MGIGEVLEYQPRLRFTSALSSGGDGDSGRSGDGYGSVWTPRYSPMCPCICTWRTGGLAITAVMSSHKTVDVGDTMSPPDTYHKLPPRPRHTVSRWLEENIKSRFQYCTKRLARSTRNYHTSKQRNSTSPLRPSTRQPTAPPFPFPCRCTYW